MDELKVMLIRDACRHLLMRYAIAADARDTEAFVAVFADEFEWVLTGREPMRRRDDIRKFYGDLYAQRDAKNPNGFLRRHAFTTVCIEPVDELTATGISYALVFSDAKFTGGYPSPVSLPAQIVEYHHVFKNTARGWKIARQEARDIFRSGERE